MREDKPYIIVEGHSAAELAENINTYLSRGYSLYGYFEIINEKYGIKLFQAMTKIGGAHLQ